MAFDLLHGFTGRKPRSLDHLPLPRRYAVRTAAGNLANLSKQGQGTIHPWQSLSRLTGSWELRFLECLQGVILRNGIRHLEAARWHTDLVLQREKQADRIGMRAATVLARAKDGDDETR
jgi:hypothetical protein